MATKKKRAGRPGLSADQVRRVRSALSALIEQHKTASAVARLLGLTPSAVSQLKSGRNEPSLRTAELVAEASGTEVVTLLYGDHSDIKINSPVEAAKVSARTARPRRPRSGGRAPQTSAAN